MLKLTKNDCVPDKPKSGEAPRYICLPDGTKHYLSIEESKDYLYGGKCPKICPVKGVQSSCPDVSWVIDTSQARQTCESSGQCNFYSAATFDKLGKNYCTPKYQKDCITLTESDLSNSDKILTDSHEYCDRLNTGCIFNRGQGDGDTGRMGEPTCLRGCLGSKYWNNPKYIWGGGQSTKDAYTGSWLSSDLELGPKYLESSPSAKFPEGWGGPSGRPWFGNGKLPKSLGVPYTMSRGKYTPPCNIPEGDVSSFTSQATGEDLAGPGCRLTPPQPRFGILDWSFTCSCPYLRESGEFKSDAWTPCLDWELDDNVNQKRDVCSGCYISNDNTSKLYGHCVLGEKTQDTESELLGCVPNNSEDTHCRIKRTIEPTQCPRFCSIQTKPDVVWNNATQCSVQLSNGSWKPNPEYSKIISLDTRTKKGTVPPYIKVPNKKDNITVPTNDLCRNCSQTSMRTIGSETKYPNRSYCVLGGSESADAISSDTGFSDYLLRKLGCPSTCRECSRGFFGEPLESVYNFDEAAKSSSAFSKGPFFIPWVGKQSL